MLQKETLVLKLKEFFGRREDIEMAFLFGSEAKGRAMRESDVDIAVWLKDESAVKVADSLWLEIEKTLDRNIDLVILNQARPTVAWAAMRGIKLLIRNYPLYLKKLLEISNEAEDMQDFTIDLFKLREKFRAGRAAA